MKLISPPKSITHLHLLSVVVTEIFRRNLADESRIRILDAGCGNGHLIVFLQANLASLFRDTEFEIYGYDVADHKVQAENFFSNTLELCNSRNPEIPWSDRLKLILQDEKWPFPSCHFDFVLSNQVIEHIWNHEHFFSEHQRVLKKGGIGAHLFPLKHNFYEGHLLLPFVHRITDWYFLKSYISFMSKLGFGKFRSQSSKMSLEVFAEKHADYITFCTNYLSYNKLLAIVKQSKLRPSLKYTSDFYWHKIRQVTKRKTIIKLKNTQSNLYSWFFNHFLKYVSSITLFIVKDNTYKTS